MNTLENSSSFSNMAEQKNKITKEEFYNSMIHGVAAAFSLLALVLMVVFSTIDGSVWKIVSCSVYGVTMVLLFLSSTFYHASQKTKIKNLFHIFDHSSIFLLIAGTYTPFLLATSLRETIGWPMFGVIWGCAIIGVVLKIFFTGRFKVMSTVIYLLMGWLIVAAMHSLWSALEPAGFFWLVAGGILYSLGTVFYLNKSLKYHHAIWHLFVFAASVCHFISVMFYIVL